MLWGYIYSQSYRVMVVSALAFRDSASDSSHSKDRTILSTGNTRDSSKFDHFILASSVFFLHLVVSYFH